MNNPKPIVSAIVSTYKSERFIRGRIEDLLNQSISNRLEIIIVNSGSPQNEDLIIGEYLPQHPNIIYIKTEERETIYKAWNRGIHASSGVFITNANTDDRLRKDAYEELINKLIKNPKVALIYADQIISSVENEKFEETKKNMIIKFPEYDHVKQLERCIVGSQPMWRSSLHFQDNIWFNEDCEVSGDQEFILRVSEKYDILHLSFPLGTFYKAPDRSNKEYTDAEKMKKEMEKISTLSTDRFFDICKDSNKVDRIKNIFLFVPIPIFSLMKRCVRLWDNKMYPKYFFHTIEFIYFYKSLLFFKRGDEKKALKICRKFLKYRKSNLILYVHDKITN